ncbi:glycosyl transferase family 4 [Pedobacter psychrophilus]|uniref:Glycosyl transferase family 4 n=1 Tax=Pedobacter psychrophilus TaxID=1826909 RepID=A0A179DCZ5_9SPHI|nr:glycosyl transferase family 4 [Pedobacter psychrophilus]OAQ38784.1 glycosyl transferase family 4 [Pedobacter psychrophilus]
MLIFILALIVFFILEITYFKIANHFNIIDKPNLRSSHTQITLRGGGVIFPIALIIGILIYEPTQIYLALGVFSIATVSFLDDILTLNNKLRIGVHLLSVMILLAQIFTNQNIPFSLLFNLASCFLILASIIIIIGIINAYNFMDGINGITFLYSFVALISCLYIQKYLAIPLINENIFYLIIASLIVFGYFNLRKKAKAFAGDVGSIAMALIISFFIGTLILVTNDFKWVLLLGVYGLDAVATIFCRIIRKENIFDAHRSHFYQYLANDKKWSHITISILYAITQMILNIILIYVNNYLFIALIFIALVILYASTRLKLEGKEKLFVKY